MSEIRIPSPAGVRELARVWEARAEIADAVPTPSGPLVAKCYRACAHDLLTLMGWSAPLTPAAARDALARSLGVND